MDRQNRTGTGEITRGHTGGRSWRKQGPRQGRRGKGRTTPANRNVRLPKGAVGRVEGLEVSRRSHEKDRSHFEMNKLLRWKQKKDNKGLKERQ